MKLELKHLAPYLPYGLKIQGNTHGEIAELSCCTDTSVNIKGHSFQYGMWADIFDIKPILRPLSDLTKEIEVNGNKFIPLEVLGQIYVKDGFFEDGVFGWGEATGGGDEQDYYLTITQEDNHLLYFNVWCGNPEESGSFVTEQTELPYYYYNRLIEWHFDVNNLIPENAVDINTVK